MRKVFVKGFLCICILSLVACKEDLIHLGSELEANKILYALRESGLDASKSFIGKEWVLKIGSGDLTKALRVLEEKKVFQDSIAIEDSDSAPMFQSKEEKESVRDKELARNLSSSIRLIPLVKQARVHIYNAPLDPLSINTIQERSASILVLHELGNINEDVIKELVSKGAGLAKEKVSVLFVVSKIPDLRSEEDSLPVLYQESSDTSRVFSFDLNSIKEKMKIYSVSSEYFVGALVVFLVLLAILVLGKKRLRKKISRANILEKLNEGVLQNEAN